MLNEKIYAIIVAGGSGQRMNSPVPKQFLNLCGLPVLMHTIKAFHAYNPEIERVLVLPQDQFAYWNELCKKYHFEITHLLVKGGATRFESVKNGLSAIGDNGYVAIHDGVRPLVSVETINTCFETAIQKGNAIPALPIVESVREVENGASKPIDREKLVAIQTPQVFEISSLKEAYNQPFNPLYTDDATVYEGLGKTICIVEGNIENIKITKPADLIVAEAFFNHTV
jgi:2-C-methyl-D-erythritol 4-phosphate cytidylyltransferase